MNSYFLEVHFQNLLRRYYYTVNLAKLLEFRFSIQTATKEKAASASSNETYSNSHDNYSDEELLGKLLVRVYVCYSLIESLYIKLSINYTNKVESEQFILLNSLLFLSR